MASQPRTISQRIELLGTQAIERALKEAGKAGEEAFKATQTAVVNLNRNLENVVRVVASVENAFSRLGRLGSQIGFGGQIPTLVQGINDFERAVGRAIRNTGLLAAGLTAVGAGVVKFAVDSVRAGDELQDNAQAAGLTTDAYQRLQAATGDAGLEQTRFQNILAKVVDQFEEQRKALIDFRKFQDADITSFRSARDPSQVITKTDEEFKKLIADLTKAGNLFARLGINVEKLGLEEALLRAGDALRALPSDLQRVQVGVEALGARGGPRFVQGLIGAREIIRDISNDLQQLNLRPEAAESVGRADRALNKLSGAAERARIRLGAVFAPAVEEAANAITNAIIANFGSIEQFAANVAQTVIPIIRDISRLLSGQEAQTPFVQEAQRRFEAFGLAVRRIFDTVIRPAFDALMAGLERVARSINSVFGTDLTGTDVAVIAILAKITGAFGLVQSAAGLALAAVNTFFQAILAGAAVLGVLGTIAGWPATIGIAFTAAAVLIVSNWEAVKAVFKEFGIDLQGIEDQWESFKRSIGGTNEANTAKQSIENVASAVSNFSERIRNGESFWPTLVQFLREVEPLFNSLANAIERAVTAIRNFGGAGTAAGEALKTDAQRDIENAQVQANNRIEEAQAQRFLRRSGEAKQATEELAAARVDLSQKTQEAAQSEGLFTRALRAVTQTQQQAATATAETAKATPTISRDFAAGSKSIADFAKQAELAKNVVSSIDIAQPVAQAQRLGKAAKDLAQPFQTAGDEAAKLGQSTKNLPDLATPIKTLGDETARTATETGRLAPKVLDVQKALQGVPQAAQGLGAVATEIQQIQQAIQQIGQPAAAAPAVEGAAAAPAAATGGAFANLVTQAQQAKDAIVAIFSGLGAQIAAAISGGGAVVPAAPGADAAPGGPFAGLVAQAQQAVTQIQSIFQQLGPFLDQIFTTAFQGLASAVQSAISFIPGIVQSMVAQVDSALQQMVQRVEQAVRQAIQAIQSVQQAAGGVTGGSFAVGGYTGSGPINRIAGVVHGGEYVLPARIVRQHGMLGFLEALRRAGDLDAILGRFANGFFMGGLVPSINLQPKFAYADGGMVGRGKNLGSLILKGDGGRTIGRVFTDQDTANSLVRYATAQNLSSGGRKPRRYG